MTTWQRLVCLVSITRNRSSSSKRAASWPVLRQPMSTLACLHHPRVRLQLIAAQQSGQPHQQVASYQARSDTPKQAVSGAWIDVSLLSMLWMTVRAPPSPFVHQPPLNKPHQSPALATCTPQRKAGHPTPSSPTSHCIQQKGDMLSRKNVVGMHAKA